MIELFIILFFLTGPCVIAIHMIRLGMENEAKMKARFAKAAEDAAAKRRRQGYLDPTTKQ